MEVVLMWLIYAISAAILWGLNYSLTEKILKSISFFTLLFAQAAIGTLVYLIIVLFKGDFKTEITHLSKTGNVKLLAIAIATYIVANIFISISIQSKNATLAGIIELAYPIFTVLFTWLLFKQVHVNWSVIAGGLCIGIGVFLISLFNY
jgi:drug/metabolite transporter (DMT)-like permease